MSPNTRAGLVYFCGVGFFLSLTLRDVSLSSPSIGYSDYSHSERVGRPDGSGFAGQGAWSSQRHHPLIPGVF